MKKHLRCFECGGEYTTMHHVVPRSRGGTATVPLCDSCHANAHHRDGNMATRTLTVSAMNRLRKSGKRIGQVPFGWTLCSKGDRLVEDTIEQAALKKILELSAEGLSLRGIARALNNAGVPSKNGGSWSFTSIKSILERNRKLNDGAA